MYQMNYLPFLLIFCLFKYTAGFTDPLLKHYKKHFIQFKNLPKSWAVYVDSIIKEALINVKILSYQDNYFDINSFVDLHLKIHQVEMSKCHKDDSHCLPNLTDFPQSNSYRETIYVLELVGSLCFDSLEKYLPRVKKTLEPFSEGLLSNIWVFYLDPNLGLNLTILHIDIPKVFGSCLRGKFLIKNFIRKELYYPIFSYCGRHTTFNHYSLSREISLSAKFYMDVTIEISLLYSIMSANVIVNRADVKHKTSFKLLQYVNILDRIIFSYHIQASKMHHLCIHIKQRGNLIFSVVDSPYYEDIWIDLRTNKFCGSTFQILLQAFSSLYYNNISDVIRYYEKFPMENYFTVNISKAQSLLIPNKYCQKVRFCIWKFKAPIQKQVDLTITMIFKGITTAECMYGGITVFDGEKPVVDICKDYRITSRNVYSNNSTLFLSVYTYQPFSLLHVNIKINITACKPIILNICQIKYFCLSHYCESNYCSMCHHLLHFTKSGLVFNTDRSKSGRRGSCTAEVEFEFPT